MVYPARFRMEWNGKAGIITKNLRKRLRQISSHELENGDILVRTLACKRIGQYGIKSSFPLTSYTVTSANKQDITLTTKVNLNCIHLIQG